MVCAEGFEVTVKSSPSSATWSPLRSTARWESPPWRLISCVADSVTFRITMRSNPGAYSPLYSGLGTSTAREVMSIESSR